MRLIAALLVLTPIVLLAAIGWSAFRHVPPLMAELRGAASAASAAPQAPLAALDRVGGHVRAARAELDALRWFAEPLAGLGTAIADWPVIGPWSSQGAAVWIFADQSISSGVVLADTADLAVAAVRQGPHARGLVASAPAIEAALADVENRFEVAAQARERLRDPLPPFEQLAGPLEQWDVATARVRDLLPIARTVAQSVPSLLGAERPVTYLILAQTNDDLRATGGFITSIGTMRLERGSLASYTFQKVYAAEGLPGPGSPPPNGIGLAPPRPLQDHMGINVLLLRDANWWADFPTASRQARDLWSQVQPGEVDGVVAFTEAGLESALRIVGSVTVDGEVVTADTLKTRTLGRVFVGESEAEWYERQTAFSQALATAVIAAATNLGPDQIVGALPIVREAVLRRDVLVSSFDPVAAPILRQFGVDGAVQGAQDDYLYLVEQNVSYGKLSPFVDQQIEYAVDVEPNGRARSARLIVNSKNVFQPERALPGYPEAYYWGLRWDGGADRLVGDYGAYGGYTRLLLPASSRVLGASGFDDDPRVDVESGRTRLGGFTWLSMGAARRVVAEWIPGGRPTVDGVYRLVVQRQPGAPVRRVTVRATIVDGARPAAIEPAPASVDGNVLTWTFDLDVDRELRIDFRPGARGENSG